MTGLVIGSALLSHLAAGTAAPEAAVAELVGDNGTLLAVIPVADSSARMAIVGYLIPGFPVIPGMPGGAGPADEVTVTGRSTVEPGGPLIAACPPATGDNLVTRPDGLLVDPEQRRVMAAGRDAGVVFLEFELLAFLAANPGRAFSRSQLLAHVWAGQPPGTTRTVDIHIHRLRRKLGPEYGQRLVTVRRVGYMYRLPASPACPGQPSYAA